MLKWPEILKQLLLQMLQQATALLKKKKKWKRRNLSKETQDVRSRMVILELKTTVTEM